MKDLTFNQLIAKSNKTMELLKDNDEKSLADAVELMKEFSRRLESESTSLKDQVDHLKKQLKIPTLKLV